MFNLRYSTKNLKKPNFNKLKLRKQKKHALYLKSKKGKLDFKQIDSNVLHITNTFEQENFQDETSDFIRNSTQIQNDSSNLLSSEINDNNDTSSDEEFTDLYDDNEAELTEEDETNFDDDNSKEEFIFKGSKLSVEEFTKYENYPKNFSFPRTQFSTKFYLKFRQLQ